jgi:hypothetical protein
LYGLSQRVFTVAQSKTVLLDPLLYDYTVDTTTVFTVAQSKTVLVYSLLYDFSVYTTMVFLLQQCFPTVALYKTVLVDPLLYDLFFSLESYDNGFYYYIRIKEN